MRRLVILVTALAACRGQTQPGPIGKPLELRQYLPDSLRSATSSADSTFRQEIPVGPDSARVELVWNTFQHDSGRFLAELSARLVAPVRYDSLTLGNISGLQNVGTKTRPIESANVQVGWFRRAGLGHESGVMNFGFGGDGRRMIGPPAPR